MVKCKEFRMQQFEGEVILVLASSTALGIFDKFIGVMYIVVGGFALCICVCVTILHIKYSLSKKVMQENGGDVNLLSSSSGHLVDKELFKKGKSSKPKDSD